MIYLDIDGVLILAGQDASHPDVRGRADLVARIADRLGMALVVSSQRRVSRDVVDLLAGLGLADLIATGDAWRTPFISDDDLDPDLPVRGQQIQAHIDAFGVGDHLVIDDDFALPSHRWIRVDPDVGLTTCDAACILAD